VIAPLVFPSPQGERLHPLANVAALATLGYSCCAPLGLAVRATQMQVAGRALDKGVRSLASLPGIADKTIVIVNAPVDILASYCQAALAWNRLPRPRHLYWLTSAGSELEVTRSGPSSLTLERKDGFLSTELERHYRSDWHALAAGRKVELEAMSVTVGQATSDGRPLSVNFRFGEALESSSYVFLEWKRDRYEPFRLPAKGSSLRLPREDLGAILLRAALDTE
jgi:hypothetical protein